LAQIDREPLIRERAYLLWEAAGRPSGKDLDYWLQAEASLGQAAAAEPRKPRSVARAAPKAKSATSRGTAAPPA
jgi:hypothetical protein